MKQILGDAEKLSNETIPRIEKPTIRIDMGIKLYEMDNHVGIFAAQLDPVNYGLPGEINFDSLNLSPPELQSLREEYLKVDDISPVSITLPTTNYH